MFKHVFDELSKELNEVKLLLEDQSKPELILKRWKEIKRVCDEIVEGWLSLEEQMSLLTDQVNELEQKKEKPKSSSFTISIAKPKEMDFSFRKGQGFYHLTMYSEAAQQFESALMKNPDNDVARLYFALSKYSVGDLDQALQALQLLMASSEDPNILAISNHTIGNIYVSNGNLEKSLFHFNKAIEYDSSFSEAFFNAGAVHYQLGEFDKSIEFLKKSIYLSPDDWEAMIVMAACLSQLGYNRKAYELKKQAVEISSHPRTELEFARTCEETGLYDQANATYERLEKRSVFAEHAYSGLFWCSIHTNNVQKAMGWIKKGLSLFPHHLELNLMLALMYKKNNQLKKAKQVLEHIVNQRMSIDFSHLTFKRMEKMSNHFSNRLQHELQPNINAFLQLGSIYFTKGDYVKAFRCYDEAEKQSENKQNFPIYKGLCLYAMQQPEKAREDWMHWITS